IVVERSTANGPLPTVLTARCYGWYLSNCGRPIIDWEVWLNCRRATVHRRTANCYGPVDRRRWTVKCRQLRAGSRSRTGGLQLGKLTLYQLSYTRINGINIRGFGSLLQQQE